MSSSSSRKPRDVPAPATKPRREGTLRRVHILIPDTNSPAFRAEAHRQSLAVAASHAEKDDQDFIDAISDRH